MSGRILTAGSICDNHIHDDKKNILFGILEEQKGESSMSAESQKSETPSFTAVSLFDVPKSILKCKTHFVKYLNFFVLFFSCILQYAACIRHFLKSICGKFHVFFIVLRVKCAPIWEFMGHFCEMR